MIFSLSLTAKLPRTAVVSFENGYVEFDNYNRSTRAKITFLDADEELIIDCDEGLSPLTYEIADMERAVSGGENKMRLDLTRDVMEIMTKTRYEWGVRYPEEM